MRRLVLLAMLVAASPACVQVTDTGSISFHPQGWLYTDYTSPVVENMHNTPRGSRLVELDSHYLEEPITRANLSVEWRSRAIGDAAKRFGLSKIYFADQHIFSICGDIYRRQTIRVWGD